MGLGNAYARPPKITATEVGGASEQAGSSQEHYASGDASDSRERDHGKDTPQNYGYNRKSSTQ